MKFSAVAAPALLLSFFFVPTLANDAAVPMVDRHEAQLRRLESLIDSLSETVSRLESALRSPPAPSAAGAAPVGGVSVTKHKTSWSDRFQFAAAARLESDPSCGTVLPYENLDGVSKYFAVGDSRGRVYVFSSTGDLLMELPSASNSSVTSMLSYLSLGRNESLLFAGHSDGSIVAHRLSETSGGEDWPVLSRGSSRPFVRAAQRELDSPPMLGLEFRQVGGARYIIASDGGGRIRVFTENGSLYGTAIAAAGRPLAFMKQRLLFLTETGAGSLDLRSMTVRETDCEGLNGSLAKSYAFDLSERSKAYGFTSEGNLIHVVLLGDANNLKCRVRSIRKSDIQGQLSVQAIKGYFIAVTQDRVLVYNVSSQYYVRSGAPRLLFFAMIQEIRSLFLKLDASDQDGFLVKKPLVLADREKLIVVGLGCGYIGIYRSNFPEFKVESNAVVWSGPALLFLLFLIASWQFYVKKKDALSFGWMPEVSFNGTSNDASIGSSLLSAGPSGRGFAQPSSGSSDLAELRSSSLRGPTRRYVYPHSRYQGGGSSGIPYKPASGDTGFRGSTDLNHRGQAVEPPGFAERRDPLFTSAQVAENHID